MSFLPNTCPEPNLASHLFGPIDHQETERLGFDYSGDMLAGEIVTAAVVTAWAISGVDPSPQELIVGPAMINATDMLVLQNVTGRAPNVTYRLRCKLTTSSGRVILKWGQLEVVRR